LAGEHPAEFQLLERGDRLVEFAERFLEQDRIVFVVREGDQLGDLIELLLELKDGIDVFGEVGAFLAEGLGVLRLIPNFGVAEFQFDFGQAFLFAIEVKDTP
jgi:hypothetical protein